MSNNGSPQIIEYTDPIEGFKGWLVIDSREHRICAGGMRMQTGLQPDHLVRLARNMTCKMRITGLRLDGAKSGMDYNPDSPGKHVAMARFLRAMRPHIETVYSMGPDLNVTMEELENTASAVGIPSVKMAIARAQNIDLPYFLERMATFNHFVYQGWTLGNLRAGYGVAMAVLAVLEHLQIPPEKASVAIQGFGSLAKATAFTLKNEGVKIIGFSDAEKAVITGSGGGLDLDKLFAVNSTMLPSSFSEKSMHILPKEEIIRRTCDVLVPAAVEGTIDTKNVGGIRVKALVPGANLAVSDEAVRMLHGMGILTLPDFLAGCGGSLSMGGLFGPPDHPSPEDVLFYISRRMRSLVKDVLARSTGKGISAVEAAMEMCRERKAQPGTKPYGPL